MYVATPPDRRAANQILGEPICFWIRHISEWDGDKIAELARHLNFYLTYYDDASSHVLIHEPKVDDVNPRTRYIAGRFPDQIRAKELDDNLMYFWMACRSGDAGRRFVYYYRIIEYASSLYLNNVARAAIKKTLSTPHALDDMEELTDRVVSAIQRSKLDDYSKYESVLRDTVDPELLWREMQNNLDTFSKDIVFEGGFKLGPLVDPKSRKEDFLPKGIESFAGAARDIRNALSHGKDQKSGHVIAPTVSNFAKLEPWVHLISIAAGEVLLYQNIL